MSDSVEYIKNNETKYDDFKIIKNSLVFIDKITELNILPIITNISYDRDGKVKLENYIYHYLQKIGKKLEIKTHNKSLNIINKKYKNIIIYQYKQSKCYYYIINNGINIIDLFNKDMNKIKNSIDQQNNNFEEYYLKNKEKEKYIIFKIFISLIIISIDDDNLIIFDYYKNSPLNIPDNIVQHEATIKNKEFENLNKLVITKAIYEDNPFDYLSDPPQS